MHTLGFEFIELCNIGRIWLMHFLGYCEANVLIECFKVNEFNKETTDQKQEQYYQAVDLHSDEMGLHYESEITTGRTYSVFRGKTEPMGS